MIDIESEVFKTITKDMNILFKDLYCTSDYLKSQPKLPCLHIIEISNSTVTYTQTNDENHSEVMYEINIFSNSSSGKRKECRKILDEVDKRFNSIGFTRIMYSPIPNLKDTNIFRIVARYKAIVGKDNTIYRGY